MRQFRLRALMAFVSACAAICFLVRLVFVEPNIAAERYIRSAPIQTIVRTEKHGEVWSNHVSYSVGRYGVSEFGSIRLAIRGSKFRGKSFSPVTLSNNAAFTGTGSGGATVSNDYEFSCYAIAGGGTYTFNGIKFQVVKGQLNLDGKTFDAVNTPHLIIVDKAGRILEVQKIGEAKSETR
jgi:hypothetical protein